MKSPDEIKKGLECCKDTHCKVCPYINIHRCAEENGIDALALIQQLEASVSEKEKVVAELSGKIGQLESQNRCFKENKESCENRMIDLAQRMPRWISVEERLPDNCRAVLVALEGLTIGGAPAMVIGSYSGGFWMVADADGTHYLTKYMRYKVTHLMPLPEPPKGEKHDPA